MRILFCNYEYPPLGGGGGVVNALLAQELAKRHDITVLTSQALGLPAESEERGVKIVRAPVFFRRHEAVASLSSMLMFIFSGLRAGKKLIFSREFDVINTHFVLPSGPVGDRLARFAGIPNILTLHGGDLYDPTKSFSPHQHLWLRLWIRSLLRRSDIVVGQSKNTLENMRHFYAPEIEGLRVPLGIQRRISISAGCRAAYGFRNDEILLVTVGRLIARKAIGDLMKVLGKLKQQPVRLLIVGTGPQEMFLKRLCADRGLSERVSFLGQVEENDKFRILKMCDIYVSTSQHEGFGLVFLEAMSCGLPIVCYDHGGQTDFLSNQITGYLVPLNDLNTFTASCFHLLQNSELRQQISQENLRRIDDLYIEYCAERYEAIFEEAIQRCGLQKLVELSSTKKLPLRLAEASLLKTVNPPTAMGFLSMVNSKNEEAAARQSGITL
jgi:glycosyltransferase involved in cell wall biosynthesis